MHRPPRLPYENVLVGSSILNSRWKLSDRHGATCLYRGGCISHSRSYSNDRASCRSFPCTIIALVLVRPGCSRKTYKYASDLSSGIIQRVKSQSQRADSQCVITIYSKTNTHRRIEGERMRVIVGQRVSRIKCDIARTYACNYKYKLDRCDKYWTDGVVAVCDFPRQKREKRHLPRVQVGSEYSDPVTRCRTFEWLSRERLAVAVISRCCAVWDFENSCSVVPPMQKQRPLQSVDGECISRSSLVATGSYCSCKLIAGKRKPRTKSVIR